MKIIDINGKEREVVSIKKINHQIRDAVHGGVFTTKEYVEVEVQGKTGRVWKEWYPIEDFRKLNPGIKI